jgi:hypothetical protein
MEMAQTQWLDDEQFIHERMFDSTESHVRDLFDQLRRLEGGLPILRFLKENANTLLTSEDIAYFVKQSQTEVEHSLNVMTHLGLTRCTDVVGLAFFGLTASHVQRQVVHDLFTWQDRWYARLALIGNAIDGRTPQFPPPSI